MKEGGYARLKASTAHPQQALLHEDTVVPVERNDVRDGAERDEIEQRRQIRLAARLREPSGFTQQPTDDTEHIEHDPDTRERMAAELKREAVAWAVGVAEVEEIDRLNIYHAGLLALRRALLALPMTPSFVLVDARRIPECPIPQRGIIHGDALSLTIAAASIIAKTTRDAHMAELDARFPGYGFACHKGYPTPQHEAALRTLGACPIHRRSFAPVRQALGLEPIQEMLFEPPPVPPEPSGP